MMAMMDNSGKSDNDENGKDSEGKGDGDCSK